MIIHSPTAHHHSDQASERGCSPNPWQPVNTLKYSAMNNNATSGDTAAGVRASSRNEDACLVMPGYIARLWRCVAKPWKLSVPLRSPTTFRTEIFKNITRLITYNVHGPSLKTCHQIVMESTASEMILFETRFVQETRQDNMCSKSGNSFHTKNKQSYIASKQYIDVQKS